MGTQKGNINPFMSNMIFVPEGSFLMGISHQQIKQLTRQSDLAARWHKKGYFARETPQQTIALPSYYISKYPVTEAAFQLFVDAGGYQSPQYWTKAGWKWRETKNKKQPEFWGNSHGRDNSSLPVIGISWYEACAYCHWMTLESDTFYRLPTEAEWEKAARGTDGRLYPWGNQFDASRCNTREKGLNRVEPVGRYHEVGDSPFGCADMAGNVSDWILSQYKPYPYDRHDGRNEVEGVAERVIRGGSWFKPSLRARTTSRGMNDPFFADTDVGFRYVLEIQYHKSFIQTPVSHPNPSSHPYFGMVSHPPICGILRIVNG